MDFLKKSCIWCNQKGFVDPKGANKVWTLVDLPDDRQAIENKWIIKKKTDAGGNVTTKLELLRKVFDKFKSWLRWDFLTRSDA